LQPVAVVEEAAEQLERDAVAVGRVRVHRDAEVARHPDAALLDLRPRRVEVLDLVLDPDVVGPVSGVEEEVGRREQLEDHATELEEARVPRVARQVEDAGAVEHARVVLDHLVVVLEHDVDVVDADRADQLGHVAELVTRVAPRDSPPRYAVRAISRSS